MAGLTGRVGMMDGNKLKSRLYLATTTKLASVHHELTDGAHAARSFSSHLPYSTLPEHTQSMGPQNMTRRSAPSPYTSSRAHAAPQHRREPAVNIDYCLSVEVSRGSAWRGSSEDIFSSVQPCLLRTDGSSAFLIEDVLQGTISRFSMSNYAHP